MSFGIPDQPQKRRAAGGGGLVFLIVLALGAFFIFGNMRTGGGVNPGADPARGGGDLIEPAERSARADSPTHPDRGDWEMQDVDIDNRANANNRRRSSSDDKTTQGDWSLEQVPAKENRADDSRFKFSDQSQGSAEKPKSTKQGDWELEEVPGKGGG